MIVASEYSSKFAKIIGKGNPVAVLATMILLSYAKFVNTLLATSLFWYFAPALGSHNVDITRIRDAFKYIEDSNDIEYKATSYIFIIISILILLFGVIFTVPVFSKGSDCKEGLQELAT